MSERAQGVPRTAQNTEGLTAHESARPPDAIDLDVADSGPEDSIRRAHELMRDLADRWQAEGADWRVPLFEAMARWPLAEESVGESRCVYLLGGEAFDWRTLAARLFSGCDAPVPIEGQEALLLGPDPPEGFTEDEFRRLLGVEKHRAHLNYLYGVTVEQALLVAVEEEIRKRRVGNSYLPNDDRVDQAYVTLYHATPGELWRRYCSESAGEGAELPQKADGAADAASLAQADAFTYWLFKRRFGIAEPARLASDTRKALEQLERMREADRRRLAARPRGGRSIRANPA